MRLGLLSHRLGLLDLWLVGVDLLHQLQLLVLDLGDRLLHMLDLPAQCCVLLIFAGFELLLGVLLDLLLLGLDIVVQILAAHLQLNHVLLCLLQHLLAVQALSLGSFAFRIQRLQFILESGELHVPVLKNQQLANIVIHLGPASLNPRTPKVNGDAWPHGESVAQNH